MGQSVTNGRPCPCCSPSNPTPTGGPVTFSRSTPYPLLLRIKYGLLYTACPSLMRCACRLSYTMSLSWMTPHLTEHDDVIFSFARCKSTFVHISVSVLLRQLSVLTLSPHSLLPLVSFGSSSDASFSALRPEVRNRYPVHGLRWFRIPHRLQKTELGHVPVHVPVH